MRTLSFLLLSTLGLAALSVPTGAQYEFDVIGFQRVQVPDTAQGLGAGWLVLVNTGAVPIPLGEWSDALHFAEISAAVGGFGLRPQSGGVATLAPGQAIGAFDPVLTSELRFGESFTAAATTQFQLSAPWPSGTVQRVRWSFVLGDRQVSGVTELEFTPAPTTFGVSALRTSAVPASASVTSLPSGCAGQLSVRGRVLPAPLRIAPTSDLPVVGNRNFALDVRVGTSSYLLGVDLVPGTRSIAGCQAHLGLGSAFFALAQPGNILLPLPIPDRAALIGQRVYLQVAALNGGVVTSLTNALELVIGPRP